MGSRPPPGPVTHSPFGHLFAFARNPLDFLIRVAREYGDIAHVKIRRRDVYLLNRPDAIEGVLVTHHRNFVKNPGFQNIKRILGEGLLSSEGDLHLRQRRLIQPSFHQQQLAAYGSVMIEHASRLSERWRDGQTVDVAAEMTRLTLAIVAKTLFDADVGGEADEISPALTDAMSLFHSITSPATLLLDKLRFGRRRFERAGLFQSSLTTPMRPQTADGGPWTALARRFGRLSADRPRCHRGPRSAVCGQRAGWPDCPCASGLQTRM